MVDEKTTLPSMFVAIYGMNELNVRVLRKTFFVRCDSSMSITTRNTSKPLITTSIG